MRDEPRAMPDKSEIIMDQMEGTRKDLANKVEALEQKIAGTVDSVKDTVATVTEKVETVKETVEQTVENVKDSIQGTVQAVTGTVGDTVASVKESVHTAVESVKEFLDVPRQVDRHPWLMMGASVALGFVGGRLLTPRRSAAAAAEITAGMTEAAHHPAAMMQGAPSYGRQESRYEEPRREERHNGHTAGEGSQGGMLSRLGGQLGGEWGKLKGMALGTLFGVARDAISQWVPETLKGDVTEMINNFTTNVGGKVIEGPVLESFRGGQGQSSPQGGTPRGGGR